jgi:hypothetical protein
MHHIEYSVVYVLHSTLDFNSVALCCKSTFPSKRLDTVQEIAGVLASP